MFQQPYRLDNLSPKQNFLFILAAACSMGLWFLTPLSDYVADCILFFVPIESDIQLGREALYSLVEDSQLRTVYDRYGVKQAGWKLVTESGAAAKMCPKCQWDFGVVKADYLNAFALPGGIIRVTDKLASILTDAEIMALIAHEVGHVLQRHSQRRMIKQNVLKYVSSAVVYEDNDGYNESFGEAIGEILVKGARFLGEQGFSRKDEYEADEEGWKLLMTASIDPRSMISMLKKLWKATGDSGETRWESTHPGTKDRIEALKEKWRSMKNSDRRKFTNKRGAYA